MNSTGQSRDGAEPSREQSPWEEDDGPEPSITESTDLHVRSSASSDIESGRHPLPVWMREASKSFHWRWVPLPVRSFARSVNAWSKGPEPRQIQKITPWFPSIQEAPLRLVDRFLPKKRYKALALGFLYSTWILIFSLVLHHQATSGNIEGYGTPSSLWCGASFW